MKSPHGKKFFKYALTAAAAFLFLAGSRASAAQNVIIPNSIYLDHNGDLVVDYQKGAGDVSGYQGYAGISINGTSTVDASLRGTFNHDNGCQPGNSDYPVPFSSVPYGNQYTYSQVWDASSSALVGTNQITSLTPIYINIWAANRDFPFCSTNGTSFVDYSQTYINGNFINVQAAFAIPQDQQQTNGFDNWVINVFNNTPNVQTGTLVIYYDDVSSSTFNASDTAEFTTPGNASQQISIPRTTEVVFPQPQDLTWYANLHVLQATSTDVDEGTITFFSNSAYTPTLDFAFPTQSSTINLFSPWLLRAANLVNWHDYIAQVSWYATNATSGDILTPTLKNYMSGKGEDLIANGIKINRTDFGLDFATGTIWYADAALYDAQDPTNPLADTAFPVLVATSSISFSVKSIPQSSGVFDVPDFSNGTTNVAVGASTAAAQELHNTSSTSIKIGTGLFITCTSPTGGILDDFGGNMKFAGCVIAAELINPHQTIDSWFNGVLNGYKSVLPFSIFFDLKDKLSTALAATEADTNTYELYLNTPNIMGHTVHIPILTANGLENAVGSTTKDMVFDLQGNFMWLVFGVVVVKIIL